jgi:hypothetical protein
MTGSSPRSWSDHLGTIATFAVTAVSALIALGMLLHENQQQTAALNNLNVRVAFLVQRSCAQQPPCPVELMKP